MRLTDIKTQIWRLVLFPALGVTLILAFTLTYLYLAQLNKFVSQRGGALSEKLAEISAETLSRNDPDLMRSVIQASLEEPYIRAVELYLKDSGTTIHSGPRMLPLVNPAPADLSQPQQRETPKSIRFAHPVPGRDGAPSPGWIEVELLASPFLVLRYQTILITLVLTLVCLALCAWFSTRLYKHLTRPLNQIRETIQGMARGQMDRRLPSMGSRELDELARAVNDTAESLEQAHRDMQVNIDQSTEDLRETLETIEIQNIELNMARKEALEASRIKSEFLANTSHEIRTPLNGILGFTNLALKTDLDEQQKEYLETIRDSSQNLLTVINDILDFSKIESGKLTLDYVPLPLRKVVEEAVHILAPDAHEKNLQLVTLLDDNLPLHLLGDPLRFKQVLTNLVSNAIKFSQQGNIVVHTALINRQETQLTLKVSVSDNGIGLTAEQKERLFSAFNQADTSSTREYGGTGLGLVICKGLVERMGGEIGVESQPEQGARFWFTARLGIDKSLPETPAERLLLGERALICSDNPPSCHQLEQLLHLWQADTDTISSIHDIFPALRKAQERDDAFRLVFMDIAPSERKLQAPLLESLTQQLRREFDCILIACCTPAHQRLFRQGVDTCSTTFINKPISYEALLETLARQMDIPLKRPGDAQSKGPNAGGKPAARILVVDDNPANLQLAGELLRGLNTEVVLATSGKEALEWCRKQEFDLIFMDIQMPGMDGIETTKRLRIDHPRRRTPIIALTAHSMTEQKAELLIAGMDDCVSKPVSENQLAHIVNRWVPLNGRQAVEGPVHGTPTQPRLPAIELAEDEQPSPVDIPLCLKLANHKPTLARDMLEMLVKNLGGERDAINQAFDNQDFEQLEELVHRLYGSCCYCGVPRLKRISGLLDKILQARQYDQVASPIRALDNEVDEILRWAYERDISALFDVDP
ncbi:MULTISPECIES: response regulator [unclassified Marinimicrobium]|jgi:two-component system sensor histidine kinase BarA|uniref:response regulator n=1 Tax=unclassified Marinimicrobium TaxID=2632100 RepID=UPI000C52A47A|nr:MULTISPECIES: response regulator [unclassified Marinimicrobium]MAN50469.1 hybrid sensor histidine kinase/response regulator [Marinimicrobium sp.]